MTGFWVGQYSYNRPGEPAVPFLANIDEAGGALAGTIDEPNTIGFSSERVTAFLRGSRSGVSVDFAKVYDGASDMAHRVDYAGTLSDDGLWLAGIWTLPGETGAFRMTREAVQAEALEEEVGTAATSNIEPVR